MLLGNWYCMFSDLTTITERIMFSSMQFFLQINALSSDFSLQNFSTTTGETKYDGQLREENCSDNNSFVYLYESNLKKNLIVSKFCKLV